MALGSRLPALLEDYKTGRQCGRYFLATVGKLLADRPPLLRHAPRIAVPKTVVIPPAPVANEIPRLRLSGPCRPMMPALRVRIWRDPAIY